MTFQVHSSRADRLACSALALSLIGAVLGSNGCSGPSHPPTVAVAGTVTYKGAPLKNGTVRFVPNDPQKGRQAEGKIDPNGSFTLSTFEEGDGAMAGEYGISITSYADGESKMAKDANTPQAMTDISAIPAKYNSPKTSGLKEMIKGGEPKRDLKLVLTD